MSSSTKKDNDMKIYNILLTIVVTLPIIFSADAGQVATKQFEQVASVLSITESQSITTDVTVHSHTINYYKVSNHSMAYWLLHKNYESSSALELTKVKNNRKDKGRIIHGLSNSLATLFN